eukprot:6492746-Amphidinium_carterae.1
MFITSGLNIPYIIQTNATNVRTEIQFGTTQQHIMFPSNRIATLTKAPQQKCQLFFSLKRRETFTPLPIVDA